MIDALPWALPLGLILVSLLLVYQILPRIFKQYKAEKWGKLIMFVLMAIYLGFDFIRKENYMYLIILILGSCAFVYMVLNAEKPQQEK